MHTFRLALDAGTYILEEVHSQIIISLLAPTLHEWFICSLPDFLQILDLSSSFEAGPFPSIHKLYMDQSCMDDASMDAILLNLPQMQHLTYLDELTFIFKMIETVFRTFPRKYKSYQEIAWLLHLAMHTTRTFIWWDTLHSL